MSSAKLLSVSADAKTIKGKKIGFLTGILYLAPADTSGINTCANASEGCKQACLFTAGRAGVFPMVNKARIRKTRELFANRTEFIAQLRKDIESVVRKAKRERLKPCIRINGTSDLPWLARTMAQEFPHVQFYDYTKHPQAWTRTLPNYQLTFSHSENNIVDCGDALSHGINVAMVFNVKRGHVLPKTYAGFKVIDGDVSDVRFIDKQGVIVGLRAKGRARKDCSGFVVKSELVQIGGIR